MPGGRHSHRDTGRDGLGVFVVLIRRVTRVREMENRATESLTWEYARFIAGLRWEEIPSDVQSLALDLFGDWLANAAAGCTTAFGRALVDIGGSCLSGGPALIVGTLSPADTLSAALVNAGASHSLEFDDSYRAGMYHPGGPTVSAAFAAAAGAGSSWAEMLTGIVTGYEISMRLAEAVSPSHYRYWHTTGTVGAFGAAASSCAALGLNDEKTAGALGLAGTQASGLWELLAGAIQAKGLHPAKAAHSGLLAAYLAQREICGPATILEGPRGVFSAMVPQEVDPNQCLADLGKQWRTRLVTFKAYPVCGHTMTSIEAALILHDMIEPHMIRHVEIAVHPVSAQVADNPFPEDAHEAGFSIQYCTAAALLKGRVGLSELESPFLESPRMAEMLQRTRLVREEIPGRTPDTKPARVSVTLADGRMLTQICETRKGDPECPLSAGERRQKFIDLAGMIWGSDIADQVYASLPTDAGQTTVAGWIRSSLLPLRSRVEQLERGSAHRKEGSY